MTLSRDALAPRYVAVVGAAVVGAATVAGAGVVRSYLARRRRRPACEPPPSLQLFDRYSSNNSARIRFWIYIRGLEASIAKMRASDLAMRMTTEAVQLFGGYGYTQEYRVERLMRDAKVTQIWEGTNQVHRQLIGRSFGKEA